MRRMLITLGIVLVALGLAWPWLQKAGVGRLPGDLIIERGSFRFCLPVTTSIIISLLLTLLMWLLRGR